MNDKANNQRRVYEDIADKLSDRINSGELPEGALLPSERELAEEYDASRTSVREALLSMQSAGLISLRQRARAKVMHIDNPVFINQLSSTAQVLLAKPGGASNFQEARMLFECGLARFAARHASPKEVQRLGVILAQNERAISDRNAFAKTDVEFHAVLAEIPRNPIFSAMNTALAGWLQEQRLLAIRAPMRGTVRRFYNGHKAIYEAIADHDPEAADEAMADHLRIASDSYWKAKTILGKS